MTITAGRITYVGTRRFADVAPAVRAPRHRRRARPVAAVAAGAHRLRGAADRAAVRLSALWPPIVTYRQIAMAILIGLVLGGLATLAAHELRSPAPAERPTFVTPQPVPAPTWTFPSR